MQNRLRTCRPTSSVWWGTHGSGTAKITVTLCTRTGSSWTNLLMVNHPVYSEVTVGLDWKKWSVLDLVCTCSCTTFFRFYWQTHHSQNAVAWHRLVGSWESCERRCAALYSALEFYQGDKDLLRLCVRFWWHDDRCFLVLDHIKADLGSDFRHSSIIPTPHTSWTITFRYVWIFF